MKRMRLGFSNDILVPLSSPVTAITAKGSVGVAKHLLQALNERLSGPDSSIGPASNNQEGLEPIKEQLEEFLRSQPAA
jgi:hypothetical protein